MKHLEILDQHLKKHPEDALEFLPLLRGEMDPVLLYKLGLDYNTWSADCIYCESKDIVFDVICWENICQQCGTVQSFVETSFGYADKENFNIIKPSIYSQVEYMKLILSELQCGKNQLDYTIIENIKSFVKLPITYEKVRKSLRQLGYKQIYLKIPSILHALDPEKFPCLVLQSCQMNTIVREFCKNIEAFQQLDEEKRMKRKNILNYHFMIHKISIQLGYDFICNHLHLPKCKKTILLHEAIWTNMQEYIYKNI